MAADPERRLRIDRLFQDALDLEPAARREFLQGLRNQDPDLEHEVRSLLELTDNEDDQRLSPTRILTGPLWQQLGETVGIATRPEKGERIGAYRVVKEVGRGGMAVVYLAERADGAFDQKVALKLLQPGNLTEDLLRRFEQERQILANLNHPAIAGLLDGGLDDKDRPFIILEYVEGQPIDAYCDHHRLDVDGRLEIFLEVARAVRYAHRQLVVHRDLKPSNILVTAGGQVKLLDFGIAKLLDPTSAGQFAAPQTRTVTRRLTPEYASPEQVLGEPVTTASDVYQLGLLLYELLTGERAYRFASDSVAEAERVICSETPRRPSTATASRDALEARRTTAPQLARRLRGDLDNIVLRSLSKETGRRYPSPAELIDDLERYRSGMPVSARPDTLRYRASKFVRRHRFGLSAATIIGALLVGYAVTATLQAREIARERDRAQSEALKALEVKSFLVEIFEVSDPDRTRGEEVTARQLLDQGSGRIETELTRQPEILAELLVTLGVIYRKIGAFDRAEALASRALDIQQSLEGQRPGKASAEALHLLALVMRDKGRFDRAEELLGRSLEIRRRVFGDGSSQVGETLRDLALLLRSMGRNSEAEVFVLEVLDIVRAAHGEEHEEVASALATLSTVKRNLGDLKTAEALGREALELRRRILPPDHPDTARSLADLAQVLRSQGDLAGAEALFRDALDSQLQALGPEHSYTAVTMSSLGMTLVALGELEEAESILRRALRARLAALPADHPLLASTFNDLGQVLQARGDLDGAIGAYREALERYPEDHRYRAISMLNLATALEAQGQLARAEGLYRESLDLKRRLRGEDHPSVAVSLMFLGRGLSRQGKHQEAQPLLETALRRFRRTLPPGHLRIAQGTESLGALLMATGHPDAALPLLEETLAVRLETLGETDSRVVAAREARDRCLEELGR